METILIVIHLIIVIALVAVVLLQKSEGGALGIGGGGNGLVRARGAANALTRITAILATLFFITSLSLGILATNSDPNSGVFQSIDQLGGSSGQGVLDQLGGSLPSQPEETNTQPSVPTGN